MPSSIDSQIKHPDTISQPPPSKNHQQPRSKIRRRVKQHNRIRVLVRHNHARRPFENVLQPHQLVAHSPHIRAELPVRPRLVDRVPLLLVGKVGVAEIVALARGDEIETKGAVRAEGAGVGVPVEAAGIFGVAGFLEFVHAWVGDAC